MAASFIILYKETKARVSRNKAPPPRRLIFIASNPRRIINRFHQKQILDSFCRVERAGGRVAIFHPHNTIFSDIFHGNTVSNRSLATGRFL